MTQLVKKGGKATNRKTRSVFIYFDRESSEPLGVRGVGSSNLPVPTITPYTSVTPARCRLSESELRITRFDLVGG